MGDYDLLTNRIDEANRSIRKLDQYYRGIQPIGYLHPEVADVARGRLQSLVINYPALVCNAVDDRLGVTGFRMDDQDADEELWRIWQANDLDEWAPQCHIDSLIYGRSFAMVWPDPEDPLTPRISVESASQMAVEYDPTTRRIVKAAKQWAEGDEKFLTIYSPTRIERYWSDAGAGAAAEWRLRTDPVQNFMGVVPVVPFINRPRLDRPMGESEMARILPLADAVNKLATDLMVSAEYHAMPRRWATGIDLGGSETAMERTAAVARQRWTEATAGSVWLSESENVKFGQFSEASLDNFTKAIEMFAGKIAALSGLPPHYLGMQGSNPTSADAIRSSEASLVSIVKAKQVILGGAWERVMRLAILMRDGAVDPAAKSMETIWRDPATPTIAQQSDAIFKLRTGGIIDARQAQEDLGYSPVQIERMQDRREEAIAAGLPDPLELAKPKIPAVDVTPEASPMASPA
jgi:hypothetical protein